MIPCKSDRLTWAPLFEDPLGHVSRYRYENELRVTQALAPWNQKTGMH